MSHRVMYKLIMLRLLDILTLYNLWFKVLIVFFFLGTSDFSIETEIVQFSPSAPNAIVAVMFTVDGVIGEGEEWLSLELAPAAPSALLSFPSGEGVFFRNFISFTIVDSDGRWCIIL